MAPPKKKKSIRVGMLVAGSAIVLMVFLFFIGSEQKIFSRKNEYKVRLDSVSGLAEGNPVKISGVTVGVVKDINLPRDPKQKDVDIQLMVDRKYAERIRTDSRARLKKLGLLAGDSYVDITPGNPKFDALEPGAMIPAARQTNVDQLISSGEDLVDNFVQISYSLKNILGRVDRGEGLLGELTTQPETKQRLTDTLMTTLNKTNAVLSHVASGHGDADACREHERRVQERAGTAARAAQRSRGEEEGVRPRRQPRQDVDESRRVQRVVQDRAGPPAAPDERQSLRRPVARGVHRPSEAAQRRRREGELGPGDGREDDQRSVGVRVDQRHSDRDQRVEAAALADPQPPGEGDREALPDRAGPPARATRPHDEHRTGNVDVRAGTGGDVERGDDDERAAAGVGTTTDVAAVSPEAWKRRRCLRSLRRTSSAPRRDAGLQWR